MVLHLFLRVKAGGGIPAGFSFVPANYEGMVYGPGFLSATRISAMLPRSDRRQCALRCVGESFK